MKTSFQADAEGEFLRSHRVRHIPRRYDDNPLETTTFTFLQYYRKEFKCILDVLISQFWDKMQPTLDATAPIAHALQVPLHEPSPEMIQKLAEIFPSDVDPCVLEAELEVFRNIVDHKEQLKNGSTNNVVQYAHEKRKALPLTWKAYQLMLTAPILVFKDERTFSQLKFVKSVHGSTMGNKRLDNLMLLNCEKDLTDGLDMYHVLSQWYSLVFPFFSTETCNFFFEQRCKLVRCSYKRRHFENTKLLAGNDHMIDIFTDEDMENILLYIFSILLSTI